MEILIRRDREPTITLVVANDASVADVKRCICGELHMPQSNQWLSTSGGKPLLKDSLSLRDYGVHNHDTLQLNYSHDGLTTAQGYEQYGQYYTKTQQQFVTDFSHDADTLKAKFLSVSDALVNISSPFRQEISRASDLPAFYETTTRLAKTLKASACAILESSAQDLSRWTMQVQSSKQQLVSNLHDAVDGFNRQIEVFRQDVDAYDAEIAVLQKKIDQLKVRRDQTNTLCCETIPKIRSEAISTHNQQTESIESKAKDVALEYERMKSINPKEELTETIFQKQRQLEKEYTSWNAEDVICWIKLLNGGYFDDPRFVDFFQTLQRMNINGKNVNDLNNGLSLKMMGLGNEEDQRILRREINRIVMHQIDTSYQSICGLCVVNTINTVIMPCGHQYFCSECAQKSKQERCPVCRANVTNIVTTYMSGFTKNQM